MDIDLSDPGPDPPVAAAYGFSSRYAGDPMLSSSSASQSSARQQSAGPAVRRSALTAAQRSAVAELLRVSPVADELGRRFAAAGHQLHLVGGSVRDALLGRLGDDLDFTTSAPPEQTLAILKGWAE